jgi:hypothetical protein
MSARALTAALFLAGCPRAKPEAAAQDAAVCPSVALAVDAAQCDVPEQHGRSASAPLEWGIGAASDRQLWLGRLACPDGAVPQTRRLRTADAPPPPSTAPRSSVPLPKDGHEILDVWAVRCPGDAAERLWLTSAYRCGMLCPPEGFMLLPAAAAVAAEATAAALRSGDALEARAQAAAAVSVAPGFEAAHFTQAATLMTLDDSAGALAAFEAAADIHPDSISGLYARVVILRASGELDAARPLAMRLLEVTPPRHPQRAPALCMAALAHHEQGHAEEAMLLAGQACARGFSRCCELPAQ